jgi:uncharacterized membrane protein YbhN (UPF0104 family)
VTDPTTDLTSELDETSAPASAIKPGGATRLVSVVGLVLGLGAVAFVVKTLVHEWPRVSHEIEHAELGWLVVGMVCAIAAMTSIGWGWRSVMRVLGVDAPLRRVIPWYYVGELGKYLPGGVWPVLGRGELARRGGVPRTRSYASVAMSLGILYLSAMFVAAAFLPFAVSSGGGFSPWMLCLLALPVGVVILHHDVLGWLVGKIAGLTKREINLEIPAWKDSLLLVVRYIPTWLLIGTATWAVARSVTTDMGYSRVMFATILSWTVGFLAVPVPSGAGIREAVLYAASGLTHSQSVFTAVTARLIFVVVDVGGAAICAPIVRRMRGGAKVAPLPHPEADQADKPDPA